MKTFNSDLWQYLTHMSSDGRPIVLYGTGDGADKIIRVLENVNVPISGIFASPGFVRNRSFHDIKVESFEDCYARFGDTMIILMCFGSSRPEVLSYADFLRSKCELYAPDVPVYGNNLFDLNFYNSNYDALLKVRSLLADEASVKTFDDIIAARLTGDVSYLKDCEVSQEESDALLNTSREGLMIDLGAYNGDTVLRYRPMFSSLTGIIAVEPDSRNMRKLRENTSELDINIDHIQAFISDKEGSVMSDRNLGRGTSAAKGNKIEIPTVTIDGLVNNRPVAFIKFDVEGSELEALNGGTISIRNNKPMMCVACYHRSEDLFALPLKVLNINPDYKVFMRHTPSIPAWDTYFYFV
ncbi:MAG: FkbM family methyltransferase [Clostridiales bacterium]|nr:FkbM family methyltransferase [Clostridiales bacterium]